MFDKQMGDKLVQGVQALGECGQLAGGCWKVVPQSTGNLNGGQSCGVMKMSKSCKEVKSANQRRSGSEGDMFKTRSNFSTWNLR